MLRILQVARDRDLQLHPLTIRALIRNERQAITLRSDPAAAAVFLDLLCGPPPGPNGTFDHGFLERGQAEGARWLAVLNETGFLGRYIPDWARIVGQMQFDTYHVFTVDEHTIEALRVLNALERRDLTEVAPIAIEPGRGPAIAPRPLCRDAAARHRQGPGRRPFRARRRAGAADRARRSACRRRRPRPSAGWCCTTCC